jgi:hypothetical protein
MVGGKPGCNSLLQLDDLELGPGRVLAAFRRLLHLFLLLARIHETSSVR